MYIIMEKDGIQDVFICQYGTNCTLLNNCKIENITFIKFDTALLSKLHTWEDYIVAVYLFAVGLASTILNGLVVYVCIRKMKSLVSCDFYILNLAIIDILMPVFGFPLTIYSSMNHKWVVGEFLCATYGFIGFFCGVVSIATLAAISFARYLKVCGVKHADVLLLHTKSSILGIYCYATFWAFLPVFGVGAYGPEPYGTSCTLAWQGHEVFVTFFLIACVLLPVIVMNVSYGRILWHIKMNRRRTKRSVSNMGMSVKKKDTYLIKMTFAMCVGFVGLWSPYAVVSLWTAYGRQGEVPIRVTLVAVLFAKLSTVVNPSVYFMMNKKFRPILNKYYIRISNRLRCCSCMSQCH